MEDEELLIKIKQGDQKAFFELVSIYRYRIINTCYRFLLNKEDAEDIAQEVFVEIFRSAHSFRAEARLSTWIYRIAVTKCLDEIKRRKRKKRISSIGRILQLDEVAGWLSGGKKADSPLQEKEYNQLLHDLLDELPDNQRVAFTLSNIEGYSNKEIADILQTSNTAVETLLSRARKKMNEKWEKMKK